MIEIYKCSGFYFYQFKHFKINLGIKVDSLVRQPNKTNIDFRAIWRLLALSSFIISFKFEYLKIST